MPADRSIVSADRGNCESSDGAFRPGELRIGIRNADWGYGITSSRHAVLDSSRITMDLPYVTTKLLHVGAVALTACLFVLRAYWMVWQPAFLARRWIRVVPHAVDTLLLLSGVWLAVEIGAAGLRGWLPAKLIGLVVYIVLGMVALKRGRTRGVRIAAAFAAVLTLAYIVCVALTKSAWGPLAPWI